MAGTRPVIGICAGLARARWEVWELDAALLPLNYLTAISSAGGLALMVPPDPFLIDEPEQILDQLDALIIAGGSDIVPALYGAEPHPQTGSARWRVRDEVEIALARRAIELDLPLLGICRGMQIINVALGGTLRQHVPDEVHHDEHRRNPGRFAGSDHGVRLTAGSLAARTAGEELHNVKSHHHQAVAEIGAGLSVSGYSVLDDLPEAIELPDRRFTLGVQWHPEADEHSPLIAALVDEARTYAR